MPIQLDHSVPSTKQEAWAEMLEIIKRLANAAARVDYDNAIQDGFRASMLLGRLEMSAELNGFWKGSDS